jgi:transposase
MIAKTPDFTRQNFDFIVAENALKAEQIFHLEQTKVSLEQERLDLKNKYNYLLEQIRLMKQRQFAKKTEQITELMQKDLIFDDLEPEEKEAEEPVTETISYTRQKKQVGRKIDTSKLPREQVIHDLSAEEKKCATCGKELEKIGEDISEQLEYIPAQLKVIEHIRPKYTCRCCETITSAEKPESPIPKSMAGGSLISDVIIKKYDHHLPWYRQAKIFAQAGIDIPANTIGNWFMEAGAVLEPLRIALWEQLTQTNVLQADETTVKILEKDIKGYMWVYHSCVPENRFVIFEYDQSRGKAVVNETLENYQGILQSDGYSGYNGMREKAGVIQLGCWAHCRRKFVEIIKLTNKTGTAHEMVGLIRKLYEIEEKARKEQLKFTERKELRQKEAKPIIEKIHKCLTKAKPPPKSAIDKAINYALNQWEYLERYLDYGAAEIDNNWIENQIRPFALGRKNWMFIGNKDAADTAAFFYSIIQTCKLNNIECHKYLTYVLNQAGKMRRHEIDPKNLLPQFINQDLLLQ